ncbi:S8 family serine peptidase [Mycoplasma sp. 4013]
MKKNIKKFHWFFSLVSTTIITVSANTSAQKYNESIYINNNSYINLNVNDYNKLINMYVPYYNKLGLRYERGNSYFTNEFDKVGIIELGNVDQNLLFSKNPDFKIKKFDIDNYQYSNHAWNVVSTIGTDFGINKNADIYFSNNFDIPDRKYFDVGTKGDEVWKQKAYDNILKRMYDRYGVKIFNISIGQLDTPLDGYFLNFSDNIKKLFINDVQSFEDNYTTEEDDEQNFYALSSAIINFYFDTNEKFNHSITKNWDNLLNAINEQALIFDWKVIFSAGNSSDETVDAWENLDSYFDKNNFFINDKDNHLIDINWNNVFKKFKIVAKNIYKKHYSSFKLYPNSKDIKGIYLLYDFLKNKVEKNNYIYHSNTYDDFNNWEFGNQLISSRNIFSGLLKWESIKNKENIINVGSVSYDNKPSDFTSFGNSKSPYLPLISAYGSSLAEDETKINKDNKNHYSSEEINSINKRLPEYLKEKINYAMNFNGTSKSAPMITGLISLLQHKLQRELSLNETKLLLISSSNYASTNTAKLGNLDVALNYRSKIFPSEIWRINRQKNKTGFGIPKFFKMFKIYNENKIEKLDFNLLKKQIDEYPRKDPEAKRDSLPNFQNLNHTFVSSYKSFFSDYIEKQYSNTIKKEYDNYNPWVILKTYIFENDKKKTITWDNRKFDDINKVYELTGYLNSVLKNDKNEIIYKKRWMKWLRTDYSNIDRIYFGNYKFLFNPEYTLYIYLIELKHYMLEYTDAFYDKKQKNDANYQQNKKNNIYEQELNKNLMILIDGYFEHIKENLEILSYYEHN